MKNIYKYVIIAFLFVIGCNSIKANDWACTHYDLNTLQYNGWDDGVSSCTKLLYMQFLYTYQTYNRYYLYLEFSLGDDNWRDYNGVTGPKPGKYYFAVANGSNWCDLQNKALAYSSQYSDYSSMAWNDHYWSASGWKRYASWQFDGTGEDSYILVEEGKNGDIYIEVYNYESGWGNVNVTIGEKIPNQITIPLTTNLERNDNTGADAEWRYLQLLGTGTGSDNNTYNAAFYIKTDSKTGTFGSADLDLTQTFLNQDGTAVEWSDVTVTVTESSTGMYELAATFAGTDGKTYNVTATYEDCPLPAAEKDPFVFTWDELYSSVWYAEGSTTAAYQMRWFRNGVQNNYPFVRMAFCFNISGIRYINEKVVPPDGTYTFDAGNSVDQYVQDPSTGVYAYVTVTQISVNTVSAYRWLVFDTDGYNRVQAFSSYKDVNGTEYYLNSGSVTVETRSDGVYVTVNARGGTGTSSTNRSFNITIVPSLQTAASGYKLDTYVNGRGTVERSSQDCFYQEGDQIILTPTPESSDWTFTGWTGDCANQITNNGDGTYTYIVPAYDCSVIANFEEGNSCTYNVSFDANGGNGTMETQTFTCGVGGKLNPIGFIGPEVTVTYNYHGATSGNSKGSETVNAVLGVWEGPDGDYDDEGDVNFAVSNGETVTMLATWDAPSVTLPTPEKTGFTFNGWYTEETGGTLKGTGGANVIIAGDITLHAQWTANGYTIRFENPDGELLQESEMSIGSIPSFGGTPERQNEGDEYNYYVFTFTGWADSENNTYAAGIQLPAVTQNATYTAQYSEDLYINLQEKKDADYYTNFSDLYNGKKAATATLERTFTRGQWATLCLPFNVTAGLMGSIGMTGRVFEFSYAEGNLESGITLYFSQAKKIDAGKGYIVNANTKLAQKDKFVFPGVTVKTDADIASSFNVLNLEGHRSSGVVYLVGTLRTGTVKGTEGNGNFYFGLSNNTIKKANETEGTKLLAYRGIFRSTESLQTGCRVRIVAESEDGQIVGELEVVDGELEDVNTPKKYMQNGILYIERNGVRYTAEGQKVE